MVLESNPVKLTVFLKKVLQEPMAEGRKNRLELDFIYAKDYAKN